MRGRVLCVTGVPLAPTTVVLRALVNVHDAVVARGPDDEGHVALALARPGTAEIREDDDEWTEALRLDLDDQIDGTWSLHLAAGGCITPLVEPLAWTVSNGLRVDLFHAAVDLARLS